MTDVPKAIGSVWNRLFDHRGFIWGEINYVLHEFEVKRTDKEVDNLFKTLETITEIRDTQIARFDQGVRENLSRAVEDLDEALFICKRLAELEGRPKKQNLAEAARHTDWTNFMDFITSTYSEINSDYEAKEEELRKLYADLKQQLQK